MKDFNAQQGQQGNQNMMRPSGGSSPMGPFNPRTSKYMFTRPGGNVQEVNRGTPNSEGVSPMNSSGPKGMSPEFIQSVIPNIVNMFGNRMNANLNPGAMGMMSRMRGRNA